MTAQGTAGVSRVMRGVGEMARLLLPDCPVTETELPSPVVPIRSSSSPSAPAAALPVLPAAGDAILQRTEASQLRELLQRPLSRWHHGRSGSRRGSRPPAAHALGCAIESLTSARS